LHFGFQPYPFLTMGAHVPGEAGAAGPQRQQELAAAMTRLLEAGGATPRSVFTRVGGTTLHHLEQGSGRPLVLLHGGSGGGANWFRLFRRLARSHRVLAPDLPGFGLSDAVQPRAPLGGAAADVLLPWLQQCHVHDAIVAGTSFGGLAALRLGQRAPHRVAGLFLLSSAGLGRELPLAVRLAALPGVTRLAVSPSRRGTRTLFRALLTTNRGSLTSEVMDALTEYLYLSARRAGSRYLAETLRLFACLGGQREVVGQSELAALPQQVTIAWGALDPFLPPAHARAAAEHCRHSELLLIPDAGHSPNWETPDAVADALERLAARVSAPPRPHEN
jgi:pimeloyl-ACP methyl ester carboxylesterase